MNQKVKDWLLLAGGTVLLTAGVYFFKIPNGFATGGVSGVGTVLGRITPVSSATWISILNVVLLLIGFAVLGRETGLKTTVCSLLFSGLTQLLEVVVPMEKPLTDQPFLELGYAMILTAIGSALIFHAHASSGGTDIVALILKKHTHLNVGMALLCVDFLIAVSSFFVFGIRTGLFSLAGLFMKAFLVDSVIESLDACKYFVIITTKPDAISDYILSHEAPGLQQKAKDIDPEAFIIITTSSEIIGRGFRGSL